MPKSVFYSWQSDLPTNVNRNFIRSCLDRAVKAINKELAIADAKREPLQTEDGVKGIPGTPDVANMIFERIDQCDILVADISIIGKIPKGRRTPNPNVMIEYGRATNVLTDQRILTVFNEAFGNWQTDRPFDLQHKLRPITYELAAKHTDDERQIARDVLTGQLQRGISEILGAIPRENIEREPETLSKKAAELQASRQFEAQKKAFCDSHEGVQAAKVAFNELVDLVDAKAAQIATQHDHVQVRTLYQGGYLVIQGLGPFMTIAWIGQYANSLSESALVVRMYDGEPQLPGFVPPFEEARLLQGRKFEFSLVAPESVGYIEKGTNKPSFSVDELADHLLDSYLTASENFST